MPDGFEAEILAALRDLRAEVSDLRAGKEATRAEVAGLRAEVRETTETGHRVEHALALVREDVAGLTREVAGLREDVLVATSLATGAEERVEDARAILRTVLKGQQELRHRVARLEDRDRERGAGEAR
jgi:chromosome segregation ATPase